MRPSGLRLLFVFFVCLAFVADICTAEEDYYKLLGVSRSATKRQLQKAYRKLSIELHPDKNPNDKAAADKYARISNAYEVLKDDEKRQIYDQFGEEGLKNQGGGGGGFADPFDFFFNRGGRQQHGGMNQGPTMKLQFQVSLEDLYLGKTVEVSQRKQVLCSHCRGLGTENPEDVVTCPVCKGKGHKVVVQQMGPGFTVQTQQPCSHCGSKGKIAKSTCPHCNGRKVELGNDVMTVIIEKGMKDGDRITFERQGDEAPQTVPGDIIFELEQLPHNTFKRSGDNLRMTKSISLLEALVGFETSVKHLDGHRVPISRKEITIPGYVLEIEDEGMPKHEWSSEFGSLFVEFTVRFPSSLTEEQKAGFKKILKT